jgi:hypothetical protein
LKAKTFPSKYKPDSFSFDSDKKFHSFNDEPAIVGCEGDMYWYKHGKLHRDNGEPAVTSNDGYEAWYIDGIPLDAMQVDLLKKINASEIKCLPWLLNEDELLNSVIEKRLNEGG